MTDDEAQTVHTRWARTAVARAIAQIAQGLAGGAQEGRPDDPQANLVDEAVAYVREHHPLKDKDGVVVSTVLVQAYVIAHVGFRIVDELEKLREAMTGDAAADTSGIPPIDSKRN